MPHGRAVSFSSPRRDVSAAGHVHLCINVEAESASSRRPSSSSVQQLLLLLLASLLPRVLSPLSLLLTRLAAQVTTALLLSLLALGEQWAVLELQHRLGKTPRRPLIASSSCVSHRASKDREKVGDSSTAIRPARRGTSVGAHALPEDGEGRSRAIVDVLDFVPRLSIESRSYRQA